MNQLQTEVSFYSKYNFPPHFYRTLQREVFQLLMLYRGMTDSLDGSFIERFIQSKFILR